MAQYAARAREHEAAGAAAGGGGNVLSRFARGVWDVLVPGGVAEPEGAEAPERAHAPVPVPAEAPRPVWVLPLLREDLIRAKLRDNALVLVVLHGGEVIPAVGAMPGVTLEPLVVDRRAEFAPRLLAALRAHGGRADNRYNVTVHSGIMYELWGDGREFPTAAGFGLPAETTIRYTHE